MTFIFFGYDDPTCGSQGANQIEEKQTGAAVFNLSGQLATLCHLKVNIEKIN
jgi:hypothetical protein